MFARPRPKKDALQPPPKKRKTTHAIEEITFDRDARADYLSGFHKRKVARIKEAQSIAAKKEREERIQIRKQIREERRQALEEHVQTVQQILREAAHLAKPVRGEEGGSGDEWDGLSDKDVPEAPLDMEEEYIDEDRYTTVTVEAVNVDREGLHRPGEELDREAARVALTASKTKEAEEKALSEKKKEWPKKKKKVFRYEDKHERKIAERKQKAKKGKPRDR
ncbi:nucleolar protein 12-domain-containing protein [Schizothecium vesticola]|uniref:Nucleolar protein 12-domain-containing protein n=1 Tax=Schizothecium vesticola TaxID=314040 RepID=A0AA40FB35_9PEZI|nr:nucleolar protein 12-domain-containing protein [Schizothecium vesticola]